MILRYLLFVVWMQDSLASEEDIQKLVSMGFERVKIRTNFVLCSFHVSILNSCLSFSIIIFLTLQVVVNYSNKVVHNLLRHNT